MNKNNTNKDEFDELYESLQIEDAENLDLEQLNDYFGFDIFGLEKEMEDYQETLEFKFSKSNLDGVSPKYAYTSDSGFDLYSTEDSWIFPLGRKLIPTGIHLDIPEGYEVQIRSKSGLALNHGLFVLNSPGTVDEGYTGEIQVILFNTTNERVKIEKGQKIAQAVLCPVVSGKWIKFVEVENILSKDRNENGFGSTGI
jgi:dUTP pyrophosphatase